MIILGLLQWKKNPLFVGIIPQQVYFVGTYFFLCSGPSMGSMAFVFEGKPRTVCDQLEVDEGVGASK